jgi:hypothetical protein
VLPNLLGQAFDPVAAAFRDRAPQFALVGLLLTLRFGERSDARSKARLVLGEVRQTLVEQFGLALREPGLQRVAAGARRFGLGGEFGVPIAVSHQRRQTFDLCLGF